MSNAMGLTIPVPQLTTGPAYATQVSAGFQVITAHTHTGPENNDGYQVPTAGLNINEDLSFQSNNATTLRSARFANQSLVLNGIGDVGCLYEKEGDLYYNNASGTPIQITSGGAINFVNNLNYAVFYTTIDFTIDYLDVITVIEADSTSNDISISLPPIAEVPRGRMYIIKDYAGTSEIHNIFINSSGTDTIDGFGQVTIGDTHAALAVISDGNSNWTLYWYDRKVYYAGEVIQLTGGAQLNVDAASQINVLGVITASNAVITNGTISTATIGNANIAFNLDVGGNVFIEGNLTVDGTIDSLVIDNNLDVGGNLVVNGFATIGTNLGVTGILSVNSNAIINGDLSVGDDVIITDDVTIGGDTNISGLLGGSAGGTLQINSAITSPSYLIKNNITSNFKVGRSGGASDISLEWEFDPTSNSWSNINPSGVLIYNIDLPEGIIVTSVTVTYRGASGHAALPAVMPEFIFYRHNGTIPIVIGNKVDTSASVAAFETNHNIMLTGLNEPIINTSVYYIAVFAESGLNALAGAASISWSFVYTIPAGFTIKPW